MSTPVFTHLVSQMDAAGNLLAVHKTTAELAAQAIEGHDPVTGTYTFVREQEREKD